MTVEASREAAVEGTTTRRCRALLGLLLFNGVTASAGGIALMTEWIPEQPSWVRETDFASNYLPGVILLAAVGGSALVAAAALAKDVEGWRLASLVAGTVMVVWIVGEIASIRAFHVLQLVYLVTGALVVALTPGPADPDRTREDAQRGQRLVGGRPREGRG